MSIKTEITRLQSAKAAIGTAIAKKGVTVPSGTKLDGMAALIGSIETGGGSAGETWVMNTTIAKAGSLKTQSIRFTSNGTSYTSMVFGMFNRQLLSYGGTVAYGSGKWQDVAYRKVTFETAPTGALLTWLQTNAVKQASDAAVQPSKDLKVTSNGSVTVVPDKPFDAVKRVNLTVNVAGSGGSNAIDVTFDPSGLTGMTQDRTFEIMYKGKDSVLDRTGINCAEREAITITALAGSIGFIYSDVMISPVDNTIVSLDPMEVGPETYSNITSNGPVYYPIIFGEESGTVILEDM